MDNLMTAEERRDAWMENQFQHGDDPHYWDYAQWIAELLQRALDLVEDLVGERHAAEPLMQLLAPRGRHRGHAQGHLARGDGGCVLGRDGLADRRRFQPRASVRALRRDPGPDRGAGPGGVDRRSGRPGDGICRAPRGSGSRGRAEPDRDDRQSCRLAARDGPGGQGEVDIHSMSVLGAVSEGRLRNLLAGEGAQLERGPNGGVVALSALTWLQKRKGFLASIWNEAESEPEARPEPVDPGRMIFVPVARDGSMFTPDLQRAGQYQIGAKGDEQHF
ncbi:hypothetical protein ACFOHS_20085 [Jhaorihella thermophila]